MFNDSKYTKWYFSIIDKARLRPIDDDLYCERHHIIPRKLGGDNTSRNLVMLTTKEHYVCHVLLPRMCINPKHRTSMVYACFMMSNMNSQVRPTGRLYEKTRQTYIRSVSGSNSPLYGVKWSEERKREQSVRLKALGVNKGLVRSKATRAKVSATKRARGQFDSKRNSMYGKKHTSSSIALMSTRKREEIQKRGAEVHRERAIDANPRSRKVRTDTGEIFPSISAACRAEGYASSTMGRNRIKSGFWSYVE